MLLYVRRLSGYPPFSSDYKHKNLTDQIKSGKYQMFESEWVDVDPVGELRLHIAFC